MYTRIYHQDTRGQWRPLWDIILQQNSKKAKKKWINGVEKDSHKRPRSARAEDLLPGKAIFQASPILDIWMSQKVESLVVCGWIENSNHNNGQYRRTTTAGIHQKIPRESIASPKGTMRWDGSTALFQCAEAPGRLKIPGFSSYDIDHELDHNYG